MGRMSEHTKFHQLLHDQISNEFYASQQYIAVATYFDNHDMPQLAKLFYRQAVEERNHAMMIVQYFLDRDMEVEITAPATPLVVLGDRDELTRLFENLIENGLKYGASGKRIAIACAAVGTPGGKGEAVVSVRDYGPGIAAEHLPRLTERFYRVDVGESRAQGGTGLGLALVKHILNRHQGRLTIDSKEGEGATFTVRLQQSSAAAPR